MESSSGQHNFTFRPDGAELLRLTTNELYHVSFEDYLVPVDDKGN